MDYKNECGTENLTTWVCDPEGKRNSEITSSARQKRTLR
jgi:hypothetical protein